MSLHLTVIDIVFDPNSKLENIIFFYFVKIIKIYWP
jgi:hypothetical protein